MIVESTQVVEDKAEVTVKTLSKCQSICIVQHQRKFPFVIFGWFYKREALNTFGIISRASIDI